MTRSRTRLTAAMALVVMGIALVVALAGFWLAARAGTSPRPVVTRVDQVGDRVAVVQIDGVGNEAAAQASRRSALRWVLVALGVAVGPVVGLAWLVTGRLVQLSSDEVDADAPPDLAETAEPGPSPGDAERERRRHLQDVVHELRTPLAVTATNLDLAATSPGLDGDLAARLAAARRGVERMARTVDDLSVHGRLAPAADAGMVDLVAEIEMLAAEHAGPARLRRVSLAVAGPEHLELPADEQAVRTAVGNLLANAVRLAPGGSVVELVCGTYEDWSWIAVRDEGPGLAPEDHERAFRRYWRGRYETDRDQGAPHGQVGARGLGLTIARQVTEAQGGHVTLDSTVGIGSTFVVWLPRSAEARTERVVADDGIHHRVDPIGERVAPVGA